MIKTRTLMPIQQMNAIYNAFKAYGYNPTAKKVISGVDPTVCTITVLLIPNNGHNNYLKVTQRGKSRPVVSLGDQEPGLDISGLALDSLKTKQDITRVIRALNIVKKYL